MADKKTDRLRKIIGGSKGLVTYLGLENWTETGSQLLSVLIGPRAGENTRRKRVRQKKVSQSSIGALLESFVVFPIQASSLATVSLVIDSNDSQGWKIGRLSARDPSVGCRRMFAARLKEAVKIG